MHRGRIALALLLTVLLTVLLAGCADGESPKTPAQSALSSHTAPPSTSSGPTATGTTSDQGQPDGRGADTVVRRVRGIDVSHHQGAIDWTAVAGDGVRFAYLKATEGTTFTDPRFGENREAALAADLRVGAYHYFSLCTPGAAQGEHFADVLGAIDGRRHLPPVVDLELLGSCATPPPDPDLLAEVRAFLRVVEERTGRRVVVYSFPDFEERYGYAERIDRRQWVRRLGEKPPQRPWWVWQHSQTGTVAGISGPVDLNRMRVRRRVRSE